MKIYRKIFDTNGNEITTEEKIIRIAVPKGTFEGERFVFPRLGDQIPGRKPADIAFTVRYKPHPVFDLVGYDILYEATLTDNEAKEGLELEIPTLENDTICWYTGKGVNIHAAKSFDERGLPFSGDQDKRGRLLAHFNIVNNSCKGKYTCPIEMCHSHY